MIRRVDRYELLEEVGSGGMAVVFHGRDTALQREVAVKLLHPHLAARAESRARFSREARAVARLKHPNIVEIYDYAGDAAVESYLVTEYVPGRTLRAFSDGEGFGFPEVGALVARALADALAHAHAAGVVHRDLKPENVLVLEAGGRRAIKLVDFGIARILTSSDDRMTMTGALVGSPNHMAPEIIEGREADERSDLFSLGTILYWLATNALPFAAPNPTATLRRVIEGDYVDPQTVSPLVSDELAAVIRHALQIDPARRTPSATALRDELDAALAASGLQEAGAELEAFLAGPPAYKAELPRRIVGATLSRADQALDAGETTRGMKLLDRVLALDPTNATVSARLKRIASFARWNARARRAGGVAAIVAVLAVAIWAAGAHWRAGGNVTARPPLVERRGVSSPDLAHPATVEPPSAPERPEPATPSTTPRSELVERGSTLDRADGRGVVPPAPTRPEPPRGERRVATRRSPSPETASAPFLVNVHVRPYAQRALLDGVEVARGEQSITFRLSRGTAHRIQVEHACCFPFVRDFAGTEDVPQPFDLKVPLRPRPARLRVEGDPSTRIYVDGKLVGTAADSQRTGIEIPVPATGETPYEAPAELRLERGGQAPILTMLRLRAGAEVTFAAPQSSAPAAAAPAADGPGQGVLR